MQPVLNSKNKKKRIIFSRGFNFVNWLPVDFSRRFNFVNLSKIRENRENLSRKQFLSLRYFRKKPGTVLKQG